MKTRKSILTVLCCFLAVRLFLPVPALAAGSLDAERDVSLTISYQDENTPLADAAFDLYLVATAEESGALTLTETFRQYPVDLRGEDDDAWKALAATLEGYLLRDGITPTASGVTDEQGLLTFPEPSGRLPQGLYLVRGHRHTQGGRIYDAAPLLVRLPAEDQEAGGWVYEVSVNPKYDSRPQPGDDDTVTRKALKVWEDPGHESERPQEVMVQLLQDGKVFDTVSLNAANDWRYTWEDLEERYAWTVVEKEPADYTVTVTREGVTFVVTNTYAGDTPEEPTTPSPRPESPSSPGSGTSKLPQTGQLWWPVPMLTAGGFLLIVLGLWRRRGSGYEK